MITYLLWSLRHGHPELVLCAVAVTVADLLAVPLLGAAWALVRVDGPAERATH